MPRAIEAARSIASSWRGSKTNNRLRGKQLTPARSCAAATRPGHRGPAALQVLREKRYPTLTVRRRAFRSLVKKLRLPPKFQVETHPFFERGELNFRFSVTDGSSLRKAVLRLETIGDHPSFRRLLNPLEHEESSE